MKKILAGHLHWQRPLLLAPGLFVTEGNVVLIYRCGHVQQTDKCSPNASSIVASSIAEVSPTCDPRAYGTPEVGVLGAGITEEGAEALSAPLERGGGRGGGRLRDDEPGAKAS